MWRILLEYAPLKKDSRESVLKRKRKEYVEACDNYSKMLENPEKTMNQLEYKEYRQISVDVPRTLSNYPLFQLKTIRQMLMRLLFVWSMRNPASSYVQGINDLCTPFIAVFLSEKTSFNWETMNVTEETLFSLGTELLEEVEADSFWCFSKVLDRIQTNYINNQPGIKAMLSKMGLILEEVNPELLKYLKSIDLNLENACYRWMNCFLMREFNFRSIIRIWDTYFSEDDAFTNFHLFLCASLILNFSDDLMEKDFSEGYLFIQNLNTVQWNVEEIDELLAKAYQLKMLYGNIATKQDV